MKSFTFNTTLSKKEVYLTMKELTAPKSDFHLFVGDIGEDSFSVMKYQHFSNNVLNPKIDAIVMENNDGTNINIKGSLNKCDRIGAFIIGIIICSIFTYLSSVAIVSASLEPFFAAIALLVFVILFYVIFALCYTLKVKRVVKILKNKFT